jgi:pimeloyl-ACP methyl ester carboxylesterase
MLPVAGGELYWESKGSGPAIVLLHGGLLDCTTWERELERLAGSYRVVRYDARGHGRSSVQQGEYSHAEDLVALLDGLEIERAVLVGLSLGGRTAIDVAIAHPERVAGLVGVAPGMSGWKFRDPVLQEHWQEQAKAARAEDMDGYVEWFLRSWTDGPKRSPDMIDSVLRERVRKLSKQNLERTYSASGRLLEVGALERVSEIHTPTLALVGELDMSDIHGIADLLVASVPGARKVLVPGVGHLINLEAPATFDQELDSFLADIESW